MTAERRPRPPLQTANVPKVRLRHEPWERLLPFLGIGLLIILVVELAVTWAVDPIKGLLLLRTMLAEVFPGREGAVPLGLAGGLPAPWLWQITWTVDWAYFCFLYPIFLTVYHRRHGKGGFIMHRFERLEEAAHEREGFVHRWGPAGVMVFMMIPFLINGPLVGTVVGRLVGIPTRRLLIPVAVANLASNALWVFLFKRGLDHLDGLSEGLGSIIGLVVFALFFVAAVVTILLDEWKQRRA